MNDSPQETGDSQPDPLGAMIQARAWSEASEEVARRLALAATPAKRTFYFLFLANLSKRMIVDSRRARERESVLRHLADAESFLESAIRESPHDVAARMTFAEFCLKHRRDPAAALLLLEPFDEADEPPKGDRTWQEHKRLALRGAAQILLGEMEEGLSTLRGAYGEAFQAILPSAYKNALWFIAARGTRIEPGALDSLVAQLQNFPLRNDRNLGRLRRALGGLPPVDPGRGDAIQ